MKIISSALTTQCQHYVNASCLGNHKQEEKLFLFSRHDFLSNVFHQWLVGSTSADGMATKDQHVVARTLGP